MGKDEQNENKYPKQKQTTKTAEHNKKNNQQSTHVYTIHQGTIQTTK